MRNQTPNPLPPDPDGQNDDRSEWAMQAIEAFERATGTDREDALADLLADLMHWADRNNFNFDSELDRARGHYGEETEQQSDWEHSAQFMTEFDPSKAGPGLGDED